MKKLILFMVVLFAGILVFAQEKPKSKGPDQQISVNKQYDEKGNLIQYDSSIVRSWSSDTTLNMADMDALHKEMENFMKGGVFGNFLEIPRTWQRILSWTCTRIFSNILSGIFPIQLSPE